MHLTSWVSCVSEALLSAVVMVPILILTFALLSPLGLRLRARPPVRDLLVIAMYAQTAPLGLNGLLEGPWHHLVYAIERARGRSSELDAAGAPTLPPPTLPPPTLYLVPAHLAPAAPMLACTLLHARPALALSRSPSRARPHPTPTPPLASPDPRWSRSGVEPMALSDPLYFALHFCLALAALVDAARAERDPRPAPAPLNATPNVQPTSNPNAHPDVARDGAEMGVPPEPPAHPVHAHPVPAHSAAPTHPMAVAAAPAAAAAPAGPGAPVAAVGGEAAHVRSSVGRPAPPCPSPAATSGAAVDTSPPTASPAAATAPPTGALEPAPSPAPSSAPQTEPPSHAVAPDGLRRRLVGGADRLSDRRAEPPPAEPATLHAAAARPAAAPTATDQPAAAQPAASQTRTAPTAPAPPARAAPGAGASATRARLEVAFAASNAESYWGYAELPPLYRQAMLAQSCASLHAHAVAHASAQLGALHQLQVAAWTSSPPPVPPPPPPPAPTTATERNTTAAQ